MVSIKNSMQTSRKCVHCYVWLLCRWQVSSLWHIMDVEGKLS